MRGRVRRKAEQEDLLVRLSLLLFLLVEFICQRSLGVYHSINNDYLNVVLGHESPLLAQLSSSCDLSQLEVTSVGRFYSFFFFSGSLPHSKGVCK
jgi:hypothetical protein